MHHVTLKDVVQGCTRQAALENQDFSCTHLAHYQLESIVGFMHEQARERASDRVIE